jgi:hypothetical protein
LNISRESAYRRIRGDIPFTVQELITLATDLEFSIDDIYDQEKQNHAFHDLTRSGKKCDDFFLFMLKKYSELLDRMKNTEKLETIMAFNYFPPPFYSGFFNLYKFSYYKWLNQESDIFRNRTYSEMALPDEAIVIQRKMKDNLFQGKNTILILDMNIILNLIKEIQYFYQRRLLTNDELLLLKEDTLHLIERYEEIAQKGKWGQANVQLYLSSLCVNSNTICFNHDEKIEPLFWAFTINPVVIQNTGFAAMQLKWINTLRRQSALITQSNEIMQAEFFTQQRGYVDKYFNVG